MRLCIASLIALVACATATEPSTDIAGTYDLVSLNGAPLPQVVSSIPPEVYQATGGIITLGEDGTYSHVDRFRVIMSDPINTVRDDSSQSAGRWTRSDSTLYVETERDVFTLTVHSDGSLTRFYRRSVLGGPYLDVTYRWVKRPEPAPTFYARTGARKGRG